MSHWPGTQGWSLMCERDKEAITPASCPHVPDTQPSAIYTLGEDYLDYTVITSCNRQQASDLTLPHTNLSTGGTLNPVKR